MRASKCESEAETESPWANVLGCMGVDGYECVACYPAGHHRDPLQYDSSESEWQQLAESHSESV